LFVVHALANVVRRTAHREWSHVHSRENSGLSRGSTVDILTMDEL
jgi:hypothetical protein